MKKGKVYLARKLTWIMSLIVLISSYFVWNYYVGMLNGAPLENINLIFVIMISFCSVMMEYVFLYSLIWVRVGTYKMKNKAKRYAYQHDRVLKAFDDGDYDMVKHIYDNRFKNDDEHKYFADKIKFAYNLVTKNNKNYESI